ncbi:MAG: DUF4960 domain-containing protein [Muribaculaceae bacterium]|nr:DUF4960 domain-containing protein [Muribaculaceae bacterium]
MKKNIIWSIGLLTSLLMMLFSTACSDFEPKDLPEVPELTPVSNLQANIEGFNVVLSWTLPQGRITGVRITKEGNNYAPINLEGPATSYVVEGAPMNEEQFYTVKVIYEGDYISEGVSVTATLPEVARPAASNLTSSIEGRTVTLSWTLPTGPNITGVRVLRDGEPVAELQGAATSYELKGQPMDREMAYGVEVVYANYYFSEPVTIKTTVPYITPKMAYLLLAPSVSELPDDDERAAASWFVAQDNAELITPSQIADLDADLYPVIWIEIDRVGLPMGWENLPVEVANPTTIADLREYTARGGNFFLANMATQLTVPLGFVPDNMAPTVFGNGEGGSGDDVWVLNAYLGWDFRNGSDQGFYDRTAHEIYKDLTFSDPNGYGYDNLPLIGPGQREDHNCLWDCNLYGRGNQPDVIRNFEVTTNSLVLATWGHVRDHCVAGIVAFNSNAEHGRCVAVGLAAYEWNQNSGVNPYQHNIEQLTLNILDYLK